MAAMTRERADEALRGLYCIAVTPFTADGAFDRQAFAAVLERAIGAGYDGILVGGTYGEFATMAVDERVDLFRSATAIVAGRVPLMLCAASPDVRLVEELGEMHAPIAEDEGRSLQWTGQPGCIVSGDRELIAQALINLIENALRHTPPGSRIRLTASCDTDRVVACVADNGLGIAPEDRKRVFERFVRLESSRSTAPPGLGLSLVRAIPHAHGAEIELRDGAPGLEIALVFPRRQDS